MKNYLNCFDEVKKKKAKIKIKYNVECSQKGITLHENINIINNVIATTIIKA
jgi:hypothetical protein